eukprot:COSAG01_NODE_50050_length_366_cov_8.659176_1_plen_70_part_01
MVRPAQLHRRRYVGGASDGGADGVPRKGSSRTAADTAAARGRASRRPQQCWLVLSGVTLLLAVLLMVYSR